MTRSAMSLAPQALARFKAWRTAWSDSSDPSVATRMRSYMGEFLKEGYQRRVFCITYQEPYCELPLLCPVCGLWNREFTFRERGVHAFCSCCCARKRRSETLTTEVVVVQACRTAIADFGGALKNVSPVELGAMVLRAALDRSGVDAADVQHVVMGQVIQTEPRDMYLSRVAAVQAGLGYDTPAMNVNRLCG